ncbi:hypothetical protein [Mycobacterium phage WXIN]|nr:hypothetical protein [Mycobacterium phage WXIN]
MGCDVHMLAEVKIGGKWETVGRAFESDYHNPKRPNTISAWDDDEDWERNARLSTEPYSGRNYYLFAALADVRNGKGVKPIAEPRGLPADVSLYARRRSDRMGCDGHSHSWLSLAELTAYDWDALIHDSGWVSVQEYAVFKEEGQPSMWSGGVGGGNVVHVDNATMDKLLAEGVNDGKAYYTVVEWSWPLRRATGDFVDETIPALLALLDWEGVEDVRIVFFFDN